jgi:hypothetical protein
MASPVLAISRTSSSTSTAKTTSTDDNTLTPQTKPFRKWSFGLGKQKKKQNSGGPVRVDVTALEYDEDAVLEKELEEIALHGGRSGLISGTPEKAAYDLENGQVGRIGNIRVFHKDGYRDDPSVTYVEEQDEADKSWHGHHLGKHFNKGQWTKKKIIRTVAISSLVILLLGLFSALIAKKNRDPQPGDPLTPEQQKVHDILARVTGAKILTDPATPQFLARQWLLYEDSEVWNASEEGIIQRYALAAFHYATGGGNWEENNWLIGPECGNDEREEWFGLSCSPEGEVRTLALGKFLKGLCTTI